MAPDSCRSPKIVGELAQVPQRGSTARRHRQQFPDRLHDARPRIPSGIFVFDGGRWTFGFSLAEWKIFSKT